VRVGEVKIPTPAPITDRMSTAAAARRVPYPVREDHKQCAKCGKVVARRAYACRRCGKRLRVRPRAVLLVLSVFLLVGMFAFASASVLLSSRSDGAVPIATVATPTREGAGTPVAIAVEATDLWMAYARSPSAADRSFKDRALLVSGSVHSIARDFEGHTVIRLETGGSFETVNARLGVRNDPAASAFSKGRRVVLACVGSGALIGAPLLSDCSVK
jgi:hypothetical protein